MQTLKIDVSYGTGDCDDCGMYDYADFSMTFEDGTTLTGHRDGHLGGGNWSGDLPTLYAWALAKLGYVVQVNGAPLPYPSYQQKDTRGWWQNIELNPNPPITLAVTAVEAPNAPEYYQPCYAQVTLPAIDAHPSTVLRATPLIDPDDETETDTESVSWTVALRTLLSQRVALVEDIRHEPFESTSYEDEDVEDEDFENSAGDENPEIGDAQTPEAPAPGNVG